MPQKAAFLDRDGTLNVDYGFVHRAEDWKFTDQAPEAIKLLRDAGYFVAVVTNQSGIAAGYYTENEVAKLHDFAQSELETFETRIDAFAYCPHGRESHCECRKPKTGMAKVIERRLNDAIDFRASWMIGDRISDIEFGKSLGTHTALLRSRYWTEEELEWQPDLIADSLFEVARSFSQ